MPTRVLLIDEFGVAAPGAPVKSAAAVPARMLAAELISGLARGLDAAVIGRLASTAAIGAVGDALEFAESAPPIVYAPDCGDSAFDVEAIAELKRRLIVRTVVMAVTAADAQRLCGVEIRDREEAASAAQLLATLGCEFALLLDADGSWLAGAETIDALPACTMSAWSAATEIAIALASGVDAKRAARAALGSAAAATAAA